MGNVSTVKFRQLQEILNWLKLNAEVLYNDNFYHLKGSVEGVIDDTRDLLPGWGFLAIKTPAGGDGHAYLERASELGAPVLIGSEPKYLSVYDNYLSVKDLEVYLPSFLRWFYNSPDTRVKLIGVTGTNGKTTITTIVHRALLKLGSTAGKLGTISYHDGESEHKSRLTTPALPKIYSVLSKLDKANAETLVMEVSSHGLELGRLGDLQFYLVAFTNLSHDHLDFHKTMENYLRAKLKLFLNHKWQWALINLKDDYSYRVLLEALKVNSPDRIMVIYKNSDEIKFPSEVSGVLRDLLRVRISDIELRGLETSFKLRIENSPIGVLELKLNLPIIGEFNVENIAMALAVLILLGKEPPLLVDLFHSNPDILRIPGRMELVNGELIGGYPIVIVDYSHTPDALKKAILTLRRAFPGREITVIFGAGGNRDAEKRPIMGRIASELADKVIVTSDNPRFEDPISIIEDILNGIPKEKREDVSVEPDRRRAIELGIKRSSPSSVVLIAGKGHEDYQEVNGRRYRFSDKEVALEVLQEIS